jgi:hypothetical protein
MYFRHRAKREHNIGGGTLGIYKDVGFLNEPQSIVE